MTPKFWKYLIATCTGSAFCLVAESDRDSVEKELETDPRLLKYRAKPQIELPVAQPPSARALRHFARVRTHKLEVIHMHDSVVTNDQQHELAGIPQTQRNASRSANTRSRRPQPEAATGLPA